ncbi:MAG: 3-phosphoshikimate 1-carboxyvinyltransferase [Promethearchaeia archaeon]
MVNVKINPILNLKGTITASPSKSYSHRAFIAASISGGVSVLKNPLTTGDVAVTMDILRKLGVKINLREDNSYIISGQKHKYESYADFIDCHNSGTSLRIFSALSLLVKGGLKITGEFFRRNRPIKPLLESLRQLGANYKLEAEHLFIERGNRQCNKVTIRGDISSQFITALLMLSPAIQCENSSFVEINLTSPLVSYPYIEITIDLLNQFGINVIEKLNEEKMGKYYISFDQKYRPQVFSIPGDFSSSAFLISAATLTEEPSSVTINNLDITNPQGDKKIVELLQEMGAEINIDKENKQITVHGGREEHPLHGINVDCQNIPDLFPILAVCGAVAEGKMVLYNAAHLRLKESDRIAAMARELKKMGVTLQEENDKLTIHHCEQLKSSTINHDNDHRIALACSIAALFADRPSQIDHLEVVNDSYPTFLEHLEELGVKLEVD